MDLLLKVFTKNVIIKDQHSFLFLSKKLEDYSELSQIFLGNLKNGQEKVFIKMVIHFYFPLDLMELLKNLIIRRIKKMKFIIMMIHWLVFVVLLLLKINVMMSLNKKNIKIGVIYLMELSTKIKEWHHNNRRNIWQVNIIFRFKK